MLVREIASTCPEVVISANTPLLAQAIAQMHCARSGIAFVFWQQDVLSLAIERLTRGHLPRVLALPLALPFRLVEAHIARHSEAVVVISPAYLPILSGWGVPSGRVELIENWAPIRELPAMPRDNAWARDHGLVGKRIVLYSGTLGLKHASQMLTDLALGLRQVEDAVVVVVSEGAVADRLRGWALDHGAGNLLVLGFQPYERLAEMHASADVLLAILDDRAGDLSVPSKVLTYLCAARPILAAIPTTNLAATTIRQARAGTVVDPSDADQLPQAALALLSNHALREELGRNARAAAERRFDAGRIGDRFEQVLAEAVARVQRKPRQDVLSSRMKEREAS